MLSRTPGGTPLLHVVAVSTFGSRTIRFATRKLSWWCRVSGRAPSALPVLLLVAVPITAFAFGLAPEIAS